MGARRLMLAAGMAAVVAMAVSVTGCTGSTSAPPARQPGEVVVYTSVDQVFAEPVLDRFEHETGIKVRAVYDAEAAKTTGLVNRLKAEAGRPRADVWWSGEIVQTLDLADAGVLASYDSSSAVTLPTSLRDPAGRWSGFGGRARVFLVRADRADSSVRVPTSLSDLTHPAAGTDPGRTGMANPVFGTASTQAAVLYATLGRAGGRDYYDRTVASGVRVLEGNGDVRDAVVAGDLDWGLTDTDDALGAIEKGAPVRVIVPDQGATGTIGGAIVIPNTVGLVAGGPNDDNGRALVDYLLAASTEQALVKAGWIQFPVRGAPDPRVSATPVRFAEIDWPAAYRMLEPSAADMKEIFLK